MDLNSEGKDITLSILRNFYGQDYKTAKVSRIARCIRLNLVYKNPDKLLTDRYRYYIRPLYTMGYITKEEMFKRLRQQHKMLGAQSLPLLRWEFEAETSEEAGRRKHYAEQ